MFEDMDAEELGVLRAAGDKAADRIRRIMGDPRDRVSVPPRPFWPTMAPPRRIEQPSIGLFRTRNFAAPRRG